MAAGDRVRTRQMALEKARTAELTKAPPKDIRQIEPLSFLYKAIRRPLSSPFIIIRQQQSGLLLLLRHTAAPLSDNGEHFARDAS